MTRKTVNAWLQDMIAEQLDWIALCGGTLAGYIDNYCGMHGRTQDEAKAIFDADQNTLKNFERRLAR